MALEEKKVQNYMRKLLLSRMRLLNQHPFYGLLLMHMRYGIDEAAPTAYTDGRSIVFGTRFLDDLSDSELDFVMMHEVMHVVLQHCWRGANYADHDRFNIACDIVVNSNILLENQNDLKSISIKGQGASMHVAPDGKEGHKYTAEQVYGMLPKTGASNKKAGVGWQDGRAKQIAAKPEQAAQGFADDHTHWSEIEPDLTLRDVWVKNIKDAANAIEIRESIFSRELLPAFAKRLLKEMRKPETDWRLLLQEFIQQDANDYTFLPPDRRMTNSPFFLPDFNEVTEEGTFHDILFMIDASASISDEMMTVAFSEVKGALEQFGGSCEGWLGFFDAAIIEPVKFSDVAGLVRIEPAGGGGTDFQIIFEYVAQHMKENPPLCIIILTDGYAPFPDESLANDIPVLWLINNENVDPPWGRVARINVHS